jgi:hypothetical protein
MIDENEVRKSLLAKRAQLVDRVGGTQATERREVAEGQNDNAQLWEVSDVRDDLDNRASSELDQVNDDTIVRRRLAQKLEFLVQDLVEVKAPTGEELEAYFDEHRADYREAQFVRLALQAQLDAADLPYRVSVDAT